MAQFTIPSDNQTILVVDDSADSLCQKRRLLSRHGYAILEARNGTDALSLAALERPALVLLNVNLPDISGFEICERLKTNPETQHIKVLQTSALRMSAQDRVKSLEVGADAYLVEPAEEEELLGTVRALLRHTQQERDNRSLMEKLSQTERLLLDAAEAAAFGIWDWDIPSGKLEWFGKHEQLAGLQPGGFSGKIEAFIEILHPEDRARVRHKLDDLMARRETQYADEYRFIYPDGTARWMRGTGRFFYDGTGEAVRMTGVVQDITEHNQAEEALRANEQRWRVLATAMPQLVWVCSNTGECIHQGPQWTTITGQSAEESLGYGWVEMVHPEDRERTAEEWRMVVDRGATYQTEYRLHMRDGTYRWHLARAEAMRDGSGTIVQWIGTSTDIDEAKHTEAALRESQAHLASESAALARLMNLSSRLWRTDRRQEGLDELLAATIELLGANMGTVQMLDPERGVLTIAARQGFARHGLEIFRDVSPEDDSVCGIALRTGQRIVIPNVETDMAYAPLRSMAYTAGYLAAQSTPLITRDGKPLGTLSTYWRSAHQPTAQELRHLDLYMRQAVDFLERCRIEEALRESQARYRTLTDAVPSMTFEGDAQGNNTFSSDQWCRYTGMTAEETAGTGWAKAVHPDDLQESIRQWTLAMDQKGPCELRHRLRAADGSYRWFLVRAVPRRDGLGRIVQWLGSCTDIDDLVKGQAALRDSEERLRLAQQAAQIGTFEWNMQTGVNTWTPELEALYGLQPGQFGQTQQEWETFLYPEDRRRALQGVEEAFTSGMPVMREFRIRRPDGVIRWIAGRWQIFKDGLGQPLRLTGVNLDITERKQAEEQLREKHRFIKKMTVVLPGMLYVFDLHERRIVYVNRHAGTALGYSEQEIQVLGPEFISTVLHPDDAPRLQQHFEDLKQLADGMTGEAEYRLRHRDGSYRWFLSRDVVWERSKDGGVQQILGMATDISERKKGEEVLRQSEERWQLALKGTTDGIYEWDIAAHTVHLSLRWKTLRGYGEDEIGRDETEWSSRIHPEDYSHVMEMVQSYLNKEIPTFTCEYRTRCRDGRYLWISDRGVAIWNKEGRPIRMIGSESDITLRKLAEQALQQRNRQLDLLASTSQELILGGKSERELLDHIFTEMAHMLDMEMFYHYRPSEDPHILQLETFRGISDDERKLFATMPVGELLCGRVAAWRQPLIVEDLSNGSQEGSESLAATGAMSYVGFPLMARGEFQGTLAFVSRRRMHFDKDDLQTIQTICDQIATMLERARLLRELNGSKQRLQRVLETEAVGVLFFDRSGTLIQANEVFLQMTGYTREQIDRRELNWRRMTPPEWVEASEAQMVRFAQTGRIGPYEKEYFLADGSRRWMLFAGRDLGDDTIAEYCVDIHDRKQAEQELRLAQASLQHWNIELERAVNEKTAELRGSQQRLRAMASELTLTEQRERKRLATELHDHLQQMLVFGKLTIGQGRRTVAGASAYETVLKKVDDILSEALAYSRTLVAELSPPVLREHGLATSLKWLGEYMKAKHDHTVTVIGLADKEITLPEDQSILLFQSARELLINSAKHAGTGQATLTMELQAGTLCITIRDEGKGFTPAAMEIPSSAISFKYGLYSIQERMTAIGGSFTLHSAPGRGTTATLAFPLAKRAETEALSPQGLATNRSAHKTHVSEHPLHRTMIMQVLLVDDHTMMRQGLRSVLDAYTDIQVVGEARDGAEAVRLVEALRPHVVVMDINMPKMNGIEATAQIKSHWPETTVIGISVNVGDDNNAAMQRAGAATVVTKEAAVEQLYDTIQQAVKNG